MDLNELSNNPEQIKQLISVLSSLLPKETENKEDIKKTDIKEEDDFVSRKKKKRKKYEHDEPNLFLSMNEKDMHKSDSEIDKKLSVYPPTKRSRKSNVCSVKCRVCGTEEKISSSLLFDSANRYKCNKCSRSEG